MQEVYLTSSEKSHIENEKQLYVLLRMIHYIEMYFAYDRIDKEVYQNEMTKLLDKYKRFSQIISNFHLDDFCKRFNIPENQISWAKPVLNNGIQRENQNKDASLFVRATSKFLECNDVLAMNAENPIVGELQNPLESLRLILVKLCERFKNSDFNEKTKQFEYMYANYLASKSINETLTASEFQEIQLTVSGLFVMMEHLTNA